MDLVMFKEEYLPKAAELLAARHHNERGLLSELPDTFENVEMALKAVEAAWKRENTSGVAAIKNGQLVGYIIGRLVTDIHRGRHAWINYEGLAIEETEGVELYRTMYSILAEKWVNQGCFEHYVQVPSGKSEVVDAWFRLGFGHEQAHALLELHHEAVEVEEIEGIEVRLADKSDVEAIKNISTLIMTHQVGSPVWAIPGFPEELEEFRQGYAELLDDESVRLWTAFRGEKLVGFQGFWPEEANEKNMMIPDKCIYLGVGGTVIEERGCGIGKLLAQKGFNDSISREYKYCFTDWRMTNLLSSRFWPKQGFKPIAYRLTRKIDPRILWVRGIVK